jgi:hypothetical protein
MNAGQFVEISDCWSSEEQPATYYRTAAAQARRLQADATTPSVKQYLANMIAHCERLAGKVEQRVSPSRSGVAAHPCRRSNSSHRYQNDRRFLPLESIDRSDPSTALPNGA